jgi:dolichol-phosphate mannosyltransferase
MKLSVVIPARNEAGCIKQTVTNLHLHLKDQQIEHELIIVNDGSTDDTQAVISQLAEQHEQVILVNNESPNGFGLAVRAGLDHVIGEAVAIYMADASDSPEDLAKFFRTMQKENVDCVFGTRFSPESRITDYPQLKLILNRLANKFVQLIFGLRYNDVTNAFKLYRREVVEGMRPFLSHHYNLTVEMPLKAIVRGYTYAIVPNSWTNRKTGQSKLRIKEMGSRYLFIVLYCLIEKWLSRRDYHRETRDGGQ